MRTIGGVSSTRMLISNGLRTFGVRLLNQAGVSLARQLSVLTRTRVGVEYDVCFPDTPPLLPIFTPGK